MKDALAALRGSMLHTQAQCRLCRSMSVCHPAFIATFLVQSNDFPERISLEASNSLDGRSVRQKANLRRQ